MPPAKQVQDSVIMRLTGIVFFIGKKGFEVEYQLIVKDLAGKVHEGVVELFVDVLHLHGCQAGVLHADETCPGDDFIY